MTSREVELAGGAPWGFRMHGGFDQNQPLRISRSISESMWHSPYVNPGRKASLGGIREGDVITSINGQPTKNMTNSEAHAMLRSAGPNLRLGLNEDKEMSPRRRSIDKGSELKRPSHLLNHISSEKAVLQAPVYATIRPPPQPRPTAPMRSLSSISSPPSPSPSLFTVEAPKIHPTNPFYTTLPINHSSSSRLPIPNGKSSFSTLDRNNSITQPKDSCNDSYDSKSSFSNFNSKLNQSPFDFQTDATPIKVDIHSSNGHHTMPKENLQDTQRGPFDTSSNDKFDTFPEHGNIRKESNVSTSKNSSDFYSKEETTKHMITEHKISKTEEVKTIQKMVLNGSMDEGANNSINKKDFIQSTSEVDTKGKQTPKNEHIINPIIENKNFYDKENRQQVRLSSSVIYNTPKDIIDDVHQDNPPSVVASKPSLKTQSSIQENSPTYKPIWRPGVPSPADAGTRAGEPRPPPPPPPPVWTPSSAAPSPQAPRKAYRPVHFEESPPPRRKFDSTEQNGSSAVEGESRLRTSHSAPVTGLNLLGTTSRLPKAQNPTVTLLQKAREGQLPRAPSYQQERDPRLPRDRPSPPSSDPVHALRRGYVSEGEGERRERESARKMSDAQKKIDGIGPITKDGMPVALRSEVKDQSRWYKKMYDTIHKNKYDNDYVTIRYKSRRDEPQRVSSSRSQYAYFDPRSGYLSEPEGGLSRLTSWSDAYDSDVTAGTTGPRRRTASVQEERRNDAASPYLSNNKYSTLASTRASQEIHKSQPGKIENYTPGKSSVVDKEAKQWWDEVMDIFDGQNLSSRMMQLPKEKKDITSSILSKSNMARALKESGYESDSTLIFKRREENEAPLSPAERRAAYRDLQAGGEPPLRGFRSPAPPRTESPNRRYVESDVNIHYRVPVRHDPLPLVPERELARQQAEHMKQLYREQRRNKYLQELQDMQSRRHQDNFMPSQKTIVPLNRYDEAERVVARALYTFNGQTSRELSFKKGDIINVRRQIDNNWYEGDIHGRIGLFPYNYVELLKGETAQSPKKPMVVEGRARAKFDFNAQTNLELPLKKGELVVLTRRIDHNWWEGRIGNKTGIFPDSYVTILQEPSQSKPEAQPILSSAKPAASPAAHGLVNGDKRSLGAHRYTPQPNSPALANAPPATQPLSVSGYSTKRSNNISAPMDRGYSSDLNNTEPLYVDTNAEAVPYRAMYKYRPQNPDELELNEGDTVYVLEKCDDGWYVGSSQRTGRFGTFPGNYVERI